MWFFPLLTRVEHQAFQSAMARCIWRMHTRIQARRTSKRRSWQCDHEGGATTMHLHRLHSASVAHPYAMAPYPSKYVHKYVHFNQRSRAIAPSSLCWPLISLIYLLFMNSLPLLFSFSLYLFLFSSTFIFLAQQLQLYRLLLLNVLLATPARNNLSWTRGNC